MKNKLQRYYGRKELHFITLVATRGDLFEFAPQQDGVCENPEIQGQTRETSRLPRIPCFSERQQERHQILLFLGGQLCAQDQIEKLDCVIQGH